MSPQSKWNKLGGRKADSLVMARKGDAGPYELGNIAMITFSMNARQRHEH